MSRSSALAVQHRARAASVRRKAKTWRWHSTNSHEATVRRRTDRRERRRQRRPTCSCFVFALFFIFGGITSLNDVMIPKLKELFTLNYSQAMLIQFAFFTAYR